MQRMRPDIPPEPIQPNLGSRRPRARHLEHARGHPQRRVRGRHLDAGDPLSDLAAIFSGDLRAGRGVARVLVDCVELGAGFVGEGGRGAEVGEEVSVG